LLLGAPGARDIEGLWAKKRKRTRMNEQKAQTAYTFSQRFSLVGLAAKAYNERPSANVENKREKPDGKQDCDA
jgi:hypothetical protein